MHPTGVVVVAVDTASLVLLVLCLCGKLMCTPPEEQHENIITGMLQICTGGSYTVHTNKQKNIYIHLRFGETKAS